MNKPIDPDFAVKCGSPGHRTPLQKAAAKVEELRSQLLYERDVFQEDFERVVRQRNRLLSILKNAVVALDVNRSLTDGWEARLAADVNVLRAARAVIAEVEGTDV